MHDEVFKHDPEFDRRPAFELLEHAQDPRLFVRARVLAALARRAEGDHEITQVLLDAIQLAENKLALIGGVSAAMIALARLWEAGGDETRAALVEILDRMGSRERASTLRFLKSEGIDGLEVLAQAWRA